MIIELKRLTQYWDKSARDEQAVARRQQAQQAFLQQENPDRITELQPGLSLHIFGADIPELKSIPQGWVFNVVLIYREMPGLICIRQRDGTFLQHDLNQSALHYRVQNRQRIEDTSGIYWRYEEQLFVLQLSGGTADVTHISDHL